MSSPTANHVSALLTATAPHTLTPLAGDAGNRRYYRVVQGDESYILMQLAAAEGFKKSEEAVTGELTIDELPFLNMARYLATAGVPVPQVIATDLDQGLILLEDFGDVSLMAAIDGASPELLRARYAQAIDELVRLQRDTVLDDGCVAAQRHYTEALLLWEFDHFTEYAIEAVHGPIAHKSIKRTIGGHFERLARQVARLPTVLVHRDWHSRNLMVKPDQSLGVIDFQDALMGPVTYDLASLLWDPYVTLPPSLVAEMTGYYAARSPLPPVADFARLLRLTALQRLMKAAGRFVYIDRVKGNPAFLADVPTCLARIRTLLAADPSLTELHMLLGQLEPRLA